MYLGARNAVGGKKMTQPHLSIFTASKKTFLTVVDGPDHSDDVEVRAFELLLLRDHLLLTKLTEKVRPLLPEAVGTGQRAVTT